MGDLRNKQPEERTINLTQDTWGNTVFSAVVDVWPYHGIKNADVYSRVNTIIFNAQNMRSAHGFAQCIATVLSLSHDVWQTNVRSVQVYSEVRNGLG